jgi:hypothetical protein
MMPFLSWPFIYLRVALVVFFVVSGVFRHDIIDFMLGALFAFNAWLAIRAREVL